MTATTADDDAIMFADDLPSGPSDNPVPEEVLTTAAELVTAIATEIDLGN